MAEQFQFDPDTFLELMAAEVPGYERLEDAVAAGVAATGVPAHRILELGIGTGETAQRVLAVHPDAELIGIDESPDMLARARTTLPAADLRVGRLEDALPAGPFDIVVSALAVHHLDGPGKADLFARIAAVLVPGGRFVLGDVIAPDDPADTVTAIDGDYDRPSRIDEQVAWLAEAGLAPQLVWREHDLVVIVADRLH